MKIDCEHGYFRFFESRSGELSDFMTYTGLVLAPRADHYTFETLVEAPEYSLIGKPFLNFPAIATFEGKPWEVFEANACVYNFNLNQVLPIASILNVIRLNKSGAYYTSNGLILPGSILSNSQKIKSYRAWFSFDRLGFRYSEVDFV